MNWKLGGRHRHDGYNLTRTVTPESFEDFVNLVIPVLQERGSYKRDYAQGTLREKLFQRGATLPQEHVGAGFRAGGGRARLIRVAARRYMRAAHKQSGNDSFRTG
jgi:hypothetical protein